MPIVEVRKQRNLMLQKIIRNLVDIHRLKRIMRQVPVQGAMRYHRWSREDVENFDATQTELLVEMGRLHRGNGVILIETAMDRMRGADSGRGPGNAIPRRLESPTTQAGGSGG